MLKVGGYNYFSQLGEKSNKQSADNYPAIVPPLNSHFDVSKILSYSIYYDHTIIITKDYEAFAIGYNGNGQIYGSLYHDIIQKYTKFDFKDNADRLWYPISAVCGYEYTLYLVSSQKNSNKTRLALSHYKYGPETELPLFLNIGSLNPVALFGGRFNAAAIDDEGSIIFIPELIIKSPTFLIESTQLPNNDKAISIACYNTFIAVVGSSGKLYISEIPKTKEKFVFEFTGIHQQPFTMMNETSQKGDGIIKLNFKEVEKFKDTKIIDVSGTFNHCFAVTENGKIFGLGSNENGQLGIGRETQKVNEFTEILSLNKYRIKAASAGWSHSLFLTENGKILACGTNLAGELFNTNVSRDCVYTPIETVVEEGATFCIAGKGVSVSFIGVDPLMCPNRPLKNEKYNQDKEDKTSNNENTNTIEDGKIESNAKNDFKLDLFEQEMINKLKTIETIGHGSQSEVLKVVQEQEFALKVLLQNSNKTKTKRNNLSCFKRLLQEYEIMQSLHHPNIVKAFGFCFGDESHPPSILMQFYPHNLSDFIDEMDEIHRVCAAFEICLGMEAVHAAHLIHRDLKPENILIDKKGHVVVSDFGISCLVDVDDQTQSRTSGVGTIKFMAPELLNESEIYDNKVDVYSFGVILFFILTGGQLPKISLVDVGIGKKAKIPDNVNKISKDLINKCWSTSADERPSFTEIIKYIKDNNFKLIDDVEQNIDQIKQFLSI